MATSSKKSYKVTNWAKYNESLVRRGDITLWFDQDVVDAWKHDNSVTKVGHPFVYSDLAIETLLTIRELFRLPYRQTEGVARALAKLMNAAVAIPHHTSLQKRAGKLKIAIKLAQAKGPIDIVVDSTGLKVYGEGEWKVREHGASKRRTWRKLHLAVDPDTHDIVAHTLTENDQHDADQVEPLVDQVPADVETFYGDGAYERAKGVRRAGQSRHRRIRRDGRKAWKESIGYHRRSLAETAVYRIKRCFGGRLKNRKPPNQNTEAALRCKLLNWFVTLGMPVFAWS